MPQPMINLEDLFTFALQSAALDLKKARGKDAEIWFTEEPETLHRTVKRIRDKYEQDLASLSDLSFDPEGAFPYSPELRQILGNLQLDGIIGRRNPSFDRFQPMIFDDTGDVLEEEVRRLLADEPQRRAFQGLVEDLKQLALPARA